MENTGHTNTIPNYSTGYIMVIWFLDSIHRPVFKRIKAIKTRFGDWICLRNVVFLSLLNTGR
jgi:hypothetical protein